MQIKKLIKMELLIDNHTIDANNEQLNLQQPFIEANTIAITKNVIKREHIIPVFVKDNTPSISQVDFIDLTLDAIQSTIARPIGQTELRVSHPIKGRVFTARHKPAELLEEWEKTIYYERMAFIVTIPSFTTEIDGKQMSMIVGGIKAYNTDNLNANIERTQKFKIFIGFKVHVCTNLCVWTDGCASDLKVRSKEELYEAIVNLLSTYSPISTIDLMQELTQYEITQKMFANLLGRMRMYNYLPTKIKSRLPNLLLSDSQVNSVTKAYYNDLNFGGTPDLSLWNLYNLFTGALKSSYIDTFSDRCLNASQLIEGIHEAIVNKDSQYNWFLQ